MFTWLQDMAALKAWPLHSITAPSLSIDCMYLNSPKAASQKSL